MNACLIYISAYTAYNTYACSFYSELEFIIRDLLVLCFAKLVLQNGDKFGVDFVAEQANFLYNFR